MKVKILSEFHDKSNFAIVYKVGEVCEFSTERAEYLMTLGLVEPVNVEEPVEKPKRGRKKAENAEQ